tara:strand:- start:2276 stop:2998 length:723 start_codon:yes stop_codon:yes gene_type:complete
MMHQILLPQIAESIEAINPTIQEETLDKGALFIDKLRTKVAGGQNFNCLILGEPGSGKSYASLRLAEVLDLNGFTADKIVFSNEEFLEKVSTAKKGDAIIYEEVGVNVSSRQWWKNFGSNAIMQTFRYKNLFFIMNCPVISFLDKNAQQLIHYSFKMNGIHKSDQTSSMRPLRMDTDGQVSFTKMMYPRIEGAIIPEMVMKIPSIKIRRDYERRAKLFKDKLNEKYLNEERQKNTDGKTT